MPGGWEMFGQTDNNQAGGTTTTAQVPSMLDNVSPQDFQAMNVPTQQQAPVQQPAPPTQQPQMYQPSSEPLTSAAFAPQGASQGSTNGQPQAPQAPVYQSNNDNPFTQNPIIPHQNTAVAQSTPAEPSAFGTFANYSAEPAVSPSGPVAPPVVIPSEGATNTPVEPASNVTSHPTTAPVDQAKLADMKQQALAHLEPLADHLDGTPEETFKTTMMMIQANDNHTLIEKALDAAKEIEDDKARAQAMLDIVNEINYFSQDN